MCNALGSIINTHASKPENIKTNKQWDQSSNKVARPPPPKKKSKTRWVGGLTSEFLHGGINEYLIPVLLKLFYRMKWEVKLPGSLYEVSTIILLFSTMKPVLSWPKTGFEIWQNNFSSEHGYKNFQQNAYKLNPRAH